MAKFSAELPNDVVKQLESLIDGGAEDMMSEMVEEGAKFVYSEVKKNMRKVFKTTRSLDKGLQITEVKHNKEDDSVYVRVEFDGYVPGSKKTKRHPKGTPIPLIALAREYGTSRNEAKRPFFRTSFKRGKITDVMLKVQKKYIPED